MKSYLIGSVAVLLAAAFTAFHGTRIEITLRFVGDPAVQAQVEDETLWQECEPVVCNGFNIKACSIKVYENKLTGYGPRYLNGTIISISATGAAQGGITYYRPVLTTGINSITNYR